MFRALLILLAAGPGSGQFPPARERPLPTSQTATGPAAREFQPGVSIDWAAHRVCVRARVLEAAGPLEFFACGSGKEHESILLLEARATHIFQALGLIGLTPGKPPVWDGAAQRARPAEGDLVDLHIEWSHDGRTQRTHWTDWVLDAEYMHSPLPLPFVFAGSLLRPDGRLACESSGAALALVDMPDALLAPVGSHSDRTAELWALPNSDAIPPPDTPVTLVFAAPQAQRREFALDFRGDFRVDGQLQRADDVAELLGVELRLGRPLPTIQVSGAMEADVRRATAALSRIEDAAGKIRFERRAGTTPQSTGSAP